MSRGRAYTRYQRERGKEYVLRLMAQWEVQHDRWWTMLLDYQRPNHYRALKHDQHDTRLGILKKIHNKEITKAMNRRNSK